MRKNTKYFILFGLAVCIYLINFGLKFYNSDDIRFERYLNKVSSIERNDIKAIDVTLSRNDEILNTYCDNEKAYLMLDLLHEIKHLSPDTSYNNDKDYTYSIRNAIETTESRYIIQIEVNELNYSLKVTEVNIEANKGKKVTVNKYFKADDKSAALIKQLFQR